MKKLICVLVAMSLMLTPVFNVYATASSDEVITIEEYISAVKAEYARYNIRVEYSDYDENLVVTRDMLEKRLSDIAHYIENSTYNPVTKRFEYKDTLHISDLKSEKLNGSSTVQPNAAYVDSNYYVDKAFFLTYGFATIRATINARVEVMSSRFIKVNSASTRRYGQAVNFQSWEQHYINTSLYPEFIGCEYEGTLTVSYNDPISNINFSEAQDFYYSFAILP